MLPMELLPPDSSVDARMEVEVQLATGITQATLVGDEVFAPQVSTPLVPLGLILSLSVPVDPSME